MCNSYQAATTDPHLFDPRNADTVADGIATGAVSHPAYRLLFRVYGSRLGDLQRQSHISASSSAAFSTLDVHTSIELQWGVCTCCLLVKGVEVGDGWKWGVGKGHELLVYVCQSQGSRLGSL